METQQVKFGVDDRVRWVSQAGGYEKIKHGIIYKVILAGESPHLSAEDIMKFNVSALDSGFARNHENYIVRVPSKTGKGKDKLYRPVVSKLERCDW